MACGDLACPGISGSAHRGNSIVVEEKGRLKVSKIEVKLWQEASGQKWTLLNKKQRYQGAVNRGITKGDY